MKNLLSNLVARQLGQVEPVQPRLAARFEPPAPHPAAGEAMPGVLNDAFSLETGSALELETETLREPPLVSPPHRNARALPQSSPPRTNFSRPSSSFRQTPVDASLRAEPINAQSFEQSTATEDSSTPAQLHAPVEPVTKGQPIKSSAQAIRSPEVPEAASHVDPARYGEADIEQGTGSMQSQLEPSTLKQREKLEPINTEQDEASRLRFQQGALRMSDESLAAEQHDSPPAREQTHAPVEPFETERSKPSLSASLTDASLLKASAKPLGDESSSSAQNDSLHRQKAGDVHPNEAHEKSEKKRTLQPAENVLAEPRVTRATQAGALAQAEASREQETTAPVINVTIGRIEVRATRHAPAAAKEQRGASKQLMSLEDYLRQRAGGGAR